MFLTSGCAVKTSFDKSELKWFDAYSEGDTIVFKSEKGELDTTYITKKEFSYPTYNPIEVHGKYLPQHGELFYKNNKLVNRPNGEALVSMIKKHPTDNTVLMLDYLDAFILVLNLTKEPLKKFKQGEVYKLELEYDPRAKPTNIRTLFWHERYGLVKYLTYENVIWRRITSEGVSFD